MKIESVVSLLKNIKRAELFRGQSNSAWELLPSIARLNPSNFPSKNYGWKGIENELLDEFEKYASRLMINYPRDKLEWMIHAQHHGLPTRLLDWTSNPLKALYFAVEKHDDMDGKFFSLQPTMWSPNQKSVDVEATGYVNVFYPIILNNRVLAQEGCFTLFPQKETLDKFTSLIETENINEMTIPKESKEKIRKELDILGISDMTIYPDLDGITKSIRRRFNCL